VPNGGGNDLLVFAGGVNLATNNDLGAWSGTQVVFGPTAGAFSISGNPLTLGAFGGTAPEIRNDSTQAQLVNAAVNFDGTTGGGVAVVRAASGDLTLAGAVALNGTTTLVVRGGGGRVVTISGPINGGTNGLTLAENNVLILAGANNYTGPTNVQAGELRLNGGSLAGASVITIGAAGTPAVSAAFLLGGATGGANLTNTITIQPGDGTNRILGGTNTAGSNNFTGLINLAGGGDSTLTLTAAAGGTVNLLGAISGSSGVVKIGGGVVQLFAANTYAGPTVIKGGSLRLGGSNLMPDTGALTVDGGIFELQSNSDTVGAVTLIGGSITGSGTLTGASYTVRAGTISAALAGGGGLVKETGGTVVLSGLNSFSGGVQILGGTLTVSSEVALGAGANTVTVDGGRLNANATFTTNRNITFGANPNNALSADPGITYIFGGVLSGVGGWTKLGTGTVQLSGAAANTYAGLTTVSEGTLLAAKGVGGINAIPGDLLIDLTGTFRLSLSNQIADTATVTMNGGTFNNPADTSPVESGPVDVVANLVINGGAFGSNRSTTPFTVSNTFSLNGGSALVSRGGTMSATKLHLAGGSLQLDGGSTSAGRESKFDVGAGGLEISGGQIQFNVGVAASPAAGSMGGLLRLGGNVTATGSASFTRTVNVIPRANIDLLGAMRTFHVDGTLTIGGTTSGESINVINGGITKTGPGTLLLSGYDATTAYIGGLVIQQGKVQFGIAPALGGNSNAITIDGTTLENVAAGEVIVSDAATAARVFTVTAAGATLSSSQVAGSTNFERAGSLVGTGTITKEGPGIVRVRADNVGLSSPWIVNAGTLEVGTPLALGSGTVTVKSGALLAGRNSPVSSNIILAGGTLGTRTGELTNFTGNVDVTAPSSVALHSYTTPGTSLALTIGGVLSGTGDLTLTGAVPLAAGRPLFLANPANTYSGTFHVTAQQALFNQPVSGVGRTLGTGAVELISGALLGLRDDGAGNDGTLAYGNNVSLSGTVSSQIDVNRATVAGISTGNTFQLGSLTLGAQPLVVTGGNGYKLEFGGPTTLTANALFAVNSADLLLSGPVGGAFGLTKIGAGKMTLGSANTYTGNTSVQVGILQFNNVAANAAPNGSITVIRGAAVAVGFALDQSFLARINPLSDGILALSTNSPGGLDFSAAGANLPLIRLGAINRSELSGALTMGGSTYKLGGGGGTLVITGANTLTGTAGLDVDSAGTPAGNVAIVNAQNFSGATSVRAASLILGGADGALPGTSGLTMERNGVLLLDNDGTASGVGGVNANRLPNAAPVTLRHGTLELRAENNAGGGTNTETIGAVTYAQGSAIRVGALGGTVNSELTAQSFTRQVHGTLTLFATAPGTLGNTDRIKSVAAPVLTNGIVAPHMIAGTDATFAGYGVNGFTSAPFTSVDLTASTATDITDGPAIATNLAAPVSAYALRLGAGALSGSGVTVHSGGLILNGTAAHTSDLTFNDGSANVEALVFAAPGTTTTLGGGFTANGLTKLGGGVAYLTSPTLGFTLAGPISVHGGTLSVGLDNVADNAAFFPQFAEVEVGDGATLNFFQSAALRNLSGSGTVRMGNTNTARRTLGIDQTADGVFSGTLASNNDGVASATGTNGGLVTLQKGGVGNLELRDARLVGIRELHVLNKDLRLSGTTTFVEQATRGRLEIHQGASFTLDNSGVVNNDRLGLEYQSATEAGGYFRLSGGTFNFIGNASSFSSEILGRFNGAAPGAPTWGPGNDVINVTGAATGAPAAVAFLTNNGATSFVFVREAGASVLIRGTGLGLGAVGATGVTNVLLSSTPTVMGGGGPSGSPTISIMPGVIASSVVGGVDNYGLATHDLGPDGNFNSGDDRGIRRLTGAELTGTIVDGVIANDNVRLTSTVSVATLAIINALHVGSGGALEGPGVVGVASGTVLAAGGVNGGIGVTNPGALEFGVTEAVFFAGSDLTVGSTVSGSAGLTVGGPAKLTLTNPANTISGTVTVNGRLAVASDGALGAAANSVNINLGGTLEFDGSFTTGRLIRIGTPDLRANVPQVAAYDARIAVAAGQTATLTTGITGGLGPITLGVSLSTGLQPSEANALVKQGPGTLVLAATETFTGGTLVEGGVLVVNGTLGAESPVTAQGGTLAGTGSILGSAQIRSGGIVAPGNGGPGILNIAQNFTMAAGGAFAVEILQSAGPLPVAGTDYDQLNIGTGGAASSTGSVGLGNATLALTVSPGLANNDLFFLLLNDGLDPITGTFAGLPQGAEFTVSGQPFIISYEADSLNGTMAGGNDIALQSIPEPGGVVLLLGGMAVMATGRRRRGLERK
jgi:autotransporter-associated beta strand protein